jgi:hypothetical protein
VTSADSDPRSPTSRPRRIAALALLVLLVTSVVLEAAFVTSSVTQLGCRVCHSPVAASRQLASSKHAALRCASCHRQPGVGGFVQYNLQAADNLVVWVTRHPPAPNASALSHDAGCRSCHAKALRATTTIANVRMSHKEVDAVVAEGADVLDLVSIPCVRCHPSTAHGAPLGGTGPVETHSQCLGCHDGTKAGSGCETCHTDRSSPPVGDATASTTSAGAPQAAPAAAVLVPLGPDPHSPGWATTHGQGDSRGCPICHQSSFCEKCHKVPLPHDRGTFIYNHGLQAIKDTQACYSCHSPSACATCHLVPMPHSANYLPTHGTDALNRGVTTCENCHLQSGCRNCHYRHLHIGVPKSVIDKLSKQK